MAVLDVWKAVTLISNFCIKVVFGMAVRHTLLKALVARNAAVYGDEIQCKENIPETIQGPLLDALNEKRDGDVLRKLIYDSDCNLATEAFTGVQGTKTRDGDTAESTFDTTWPKTIKKAVEEMRTSPLATEVGCSTRLRTGEDGAHHVTLDCKYNTARGQPIR